MTINDEFISTVKSGKKIRVRIMLKDSMLVDPTMRQFNEMLDYASGIISDLYDDHDKELLKNNHSEWSETYLNNQMVAVVSNFSKERIELLKKMVKYVYGYRAENIKSNVVNVPRMSTRKEKIGIGAIVIGTVITVASISVRKGILMAGGLFITAIGAGVILMDREV